MASQVTIPVGQLHVGEQGYLPLDAIYVAPSVSAGPVDGRNVGDTERFVLPYADVYTEPTPAARVHVRRLEDGLVIEVPSGEHPTRYRSHIVPGSVRVLAPE